MGKVRQDELVDPFASNRAASKVDKQGTQSPAFLLPKADETKRTSEFDAKGYGEYMDSPQSGSLFNDITRARNQSGVEQAYHSIKRAGAEVIGGAISGFGSVGAFISDLVTESSRQEADFNNVVMQLGEDIISSTTENNPIYRENPGKAFDFGDSGYIWEQLPSVASSLSLLIPARGITGGLGMLGKMAGISGKMGKTSKFLAEVGSMSVISRNGENMRESLSVAKQADEKIREQFSNMSEGELVANIGASETGREFLTTGKEITAENYGKFVGAKAGMESYKVNASNIVFDFFQTAIAYKALAGLTRNKNITNFYLGEGGKKLAAAEAEALGKTLSMRQKFGEGFKTAIAGSLGPASEMVEEVVNVVGTKEGERVGNIAAGLDKSEGEFGTRVGKYLGEASTWDAGLWGALGGKIFESGAHLMEKITNRKGEASDVNANRYAEINGRSEHIGKITKDLVDLENMKTQGLITDSQYQDSVYKLGNQSAFDMGINAASSGQVDNLLSSINDPAFKDVLLKSMPADQKATITDEKYNTIVQNMSESILEAESVYKGINNKIQYTDAEIPVKNYILSKGMRTGYDTFLREKENVELTNQFEEMIGDPQHSARAVDVDFRDSIEIEALDNLQQMYQEQAEKYKDRAGYSEFINRRLEEIKSRKETLEVLNPDRKGLTEDHHDLVALKYKQLGNEFQINTNKEVNDTLGSKSNIKQATKEFEDVVKAQRQNIKMQYEDALSKAAIESSELAFTRADLETFNDTDLLKQYDKLQKLKADTAKQEAIIAEKPIEPAIENTPEEVAVVEPVSAVTNELKPVEDGLNKLTAAQKTRILKKFDAIENPSDAEDLKRLAVGLGIAEDSGFMQALEREILPVEENYEEMAPLVPEVIPEVVPKVIAEDVVMKKPRGKQEVVSNEEIVEARSDEEIDFGIEADEYVNPITELVTIDEVPIVEESLDLPQDQDEEIKLIGTKKIRDGIERTKSLVEIIKAKYPNNTYYGKLIRILENIIDFNSFATLVETEYLDKRNANGQATWYGMAISYKVLERIKEGDSEGVRVFLHELVHAFTANQISSYNIEKQKLIPGFKSNLTDKEKKAIEELQRLYKKVKNALKSTDYALSNLDEFIVGVFTDPGFQSELKTIESEGKTSNMFKDVVKAIGDLLHETLSKWSKRFNKPIPERENITGILEDVIAWTEDLIVPNRKISSVNLKQLAENEAPAELASNTTEEVIELTEAEVPTDNVEYSDAVLFIPNFHDINDKVVEKSGADYKVNAKVAKTINAIKQLRVGQEYELTIDTNNPYNKDNADNAAIGIKIDGEYVYYINTVSALRKQLEAATEDTEKLKYTQLLAAVQNIRNKVFNNKDKVFKTRIKNITQGTIIPGTSNLPLDIVAGTWKLAFLDPQNPNTTVLQVVGEKEQYFGTGKETIYNRDANYTKGVEYLLLEAFNFDGSLQSRTPVRLQRNNLTQEAANEVFDLIEKVVAKMKEGATLNSEEIEDLKAKIQLVTPVNRYNQEKSEIKGANGEIVYTVPKPYFKIHKGRIEFIFDQGTKLGTIWFKDKRDGVTKFVINEWNSRASEFATELEYRAAIGKVVNSTVAGSSEFQNQVVESLQKRPFNVIYSKDGMTDKDAENLLTSGRISADFGVLRSPSGEPLSNFWAKPEASLVDGAKRYQHGNLAISIDSNVKEGVSGSFESAKIGDAITIAGESGIIVGKDKSRGGKDLVVVKPAPKSKEAIYQEALQKVARKIRDQYKKPITEQLIKDNHAGELSTAVDELTSLENSRTNTFTVDAEQWNSDVTKVKPIIVVKDNDAANIVPKVIEEIPTDTTPENITPEELKLVKGFIEELQIAGQRIHINSSFLETQPIAKSIADLQSRIDGIENGTVKTPQPHELGALKRYVKSLKDLIAKNKVPVQKEPVKTNIVVPVQKEVPRKWKERKTLKYVSAGVFKSFTAKDIQAQIGTNLKEGDRVTVDYYQPKKEVNRTSIDFLVVDGKLINPNDSAFQVELDQRKFPGYAVYEDIFEEVREIKSTFGDTEGIVIEDGLTMLFTGESIVNATTPEQKEQNWKRMFGENVPIDVNLNELIQVKGELAYAVLTTAGAKLVKNSPTGTEYHEAFHAVTQEYLTEAQLDQLYDDASSIYGKELTPLQLEEKMAEDFRLYAINKDLIKDSKIKTWFQKIWNMLQLVFGRTTRDKVFANVYSGNFNYKPTARIQQFIKSNPLMMDSNPLNALFTQQEIKQYVEWGTMIVAADLPIVSGRSNREIKDNPNQYNLRLRGKARLRDYHQKLVAKGDIETAKVVERIGENWGSINDGFWNLIVKNVNRKLKYNIGFNEDQANDFQGNVQMQRDWDDRVAYTVSGKESFDFDLKRIIMLTPKLDNADSEVDADGTITFNNVSRPNAAKLQQPIDFNTVYPMLVDNMADANTVEEMMARLKELTDVDPSMFYLWNKINNNDLLKQKWFTNFRKNYVPDSHIRFTNLGNDGYSIVSESANPQLGVANQWVSNIQSLMAIANRSEEYNGYTADEIEAVRLSPLAVIKDNKLDESIDRVVDLARVLGVGVSKEILTKIVNNKQLQEHHGYDAMGLLNRVIYNDLNWVATGIANAMKAGSKLTFNERGRINTLANYVSHYQPEVIENSYLNTQGKVMFSFKKPSYLTEFFAKFQAVSNPFTVNKTAAKQELLAEIKNRLKDKSFLFSNWIYSDTLNNGLLKIKFGEKTIDNITIDDLNDNAVKNFQLFASGDLKETVSGYGAGYTDLSENDWMLTNLLNYLVTTGKQKDWSMYPIMIPSDSGNIWSIKAKRFKAKIVDGKLYRDSRLFKALFNVAQQEMARMAVASNLLFDRVGGEGVNKYNVKPKPISEVVKNSLIIGYHYKKVAEKDIVVDGEVWFKKGDPITIENGKPTGNVFAFSAMDYGDKSMNQVAELKVGGVFDRIVNNPNNMELVNEYIDGFAENLIKEEIARHLEFKESLKQSKVKDVSVLNMWSDNFELAVGEYALNTFLFNVEQANFFNGVLPEYKNMKDTAKRAKEVSTTKQTTGFSFRGKTYQAIILKDILLDAQDKEQLEKNIRKYIKDGATVNKIMKKYSAINVADAQGYITLDRLEATLKDYGRWDDTYDKLFDTARNPNVELTDKDLNRLIEVVKPFLYGRNYNESNGVYMSQQVKTSLLPLIPKLYRGTELEKLAAYMDKNNIGEAYFESAVKVGRQKLSDIFTDGRLNKDWDKNIVPHTFQNADWGLQLDVPDHLKDQQNKLGVQIAKLLLANLSNEAVYDFAGNKKDGKELRSMFHDLVSKNIADSSKELLEELGATTDADGNIQIKNMSKISNILKDEIVSRGLSSNYLKAVSVKDNKFVMPLSSTNLRNKFMSILSSLFTSRVTNQKFPGGHVVVASPAMLQRAKESGTLIVDAQGIEFVNSVKHRIIDGTFQLKAINIEGDKITKVEALLPAWSADFFRSGSRININELSEEMRTMIGYRIPTEGKYSTTVIEIVGFLPESSGSTIILPYELVAQTGWDFDVDSVYLMQKVFETKVNGKIASEVMADELGIEQKLASQYIKEIRKNTGLIEVPPEARDSYDKFAAEQFAFEVIPSGEKFTDARNNTIFDIFKAILESPNSFEEIVNGGNFDDAVDVKKRVEELLGEDENTGNHLTRKTQDEIRTNFMAGRALKGMAADVNSALAVLQNVGARFRPGLSFNFKYDNEVNEHRIIANNIKGTYTNVVNAPITDTAAQILAMSLDIVKEGFPYNLNTYTFNTAMAMIATGVPIIETGLYIRQPILNRLASKIMNNKSVIDDIEEREVVITKKEYQAAMYSTMVRAGMITMEQAAEDNMVDKKTKALVPFSRMRVYFGKKAIDRLQLGLDTSKAYSKQELEDMIKMDKASYRNSSELGKRVDYYREQLNILNQWQTKYYDMGQEFGHVVSSLKADKIGAGPDLNITPEFYGRITREGVTQLTFGNDSPVIVSGDTGMSINNAIYIHDAYPVFKAYLKHSNDAAFQLFSPLFLETRQGYRDLKERLRMGLRLKNSEVVEARLNKFLFKYLFSKYGINNITDSESQRILGLSKEAGKYSDLSIDQYNQLSAAEKLMYLNENVKYKDGVLQEGFKNAFDILNRLTPKLEEGVVNKRQIHSLSFSKPKSSDNIDDFIIESFDNILNSPNEYIRSLAEDLIKYDLIVNGLTYSANSWREFIPMERQEADGLGQSVSNMMAQTTASENPDLEDYFARNNWDNVNIVPVAKSKYNYDEQGNRLKEDVDTGAGYEQIDAADADFFNWDAYINTLQPIAVPKDKLSREKKAIKNARYLLIKNQEKSVLLKRFFFNDPRDLMEDRNSPVYYYPVNKLGSMYIGNEIGSTSILDNNNFPISEGEMLMYLESQGIVAAMDLVDANAAEDGQKDCLL